VAHNEYNKAINEYNANRSLGARKNFEAEYLRIGEESYPLTTIKV